MPVIANLSDTNITVLMPELILVGFAMLVMLIDMFTNERQSDVRSLLPWVALVGVLVAVHRCTVIWGEMPLSFQGAAALDSFALGVKLVVLTAAGLGILLSTGYMPSVNKQTGEYYALLLLCSAGMMVMGAATDLITVFLSLEIFSLALYIMCGLNREKPAGIEAAMKYFLLGAFASGFFVYGAALIYGATGSTQYNVIAAALASGNVDTFLLYPGIALLLVGFGFKVSMAPFHMWTPDVYQGAPTPVTAFMSVGTKMAAFAAFIRLLVFALPEAQPVWGWAVAGFALVTMVLGNFAALRQTSLKRMLAYSSIAHAGYILVGLASGVQAAASAAVFYLFAYAFMNIGAFAVVIMLERAGEGDALANRATGLAKRWPYLAAAMAIFMFSLSGLPPLAGFIGKFLIFKAAADGGWIMLAILGMMASAVSAYYYLRVVIAMYFGDPNEATATERYSWPALNVGVAIAAVFTVLIGVYPGLWSGWFLF